MASFLSSVQLNVRLNSLNGGSMTDVILGFCPLDHRFNGSDTTRSHFVRAVNTALLNRANLSNFLRTRVHP